MGAGIMLDPSLWPLDVASLNKGDVVSEKMIVRLVGQRPGLPSFDHGLLKVRAEIDRQLRELGKDWAIEREQNTLMLLADADATDYLDRRQSHHRRSMRVCHRKQVAVNVAGFDADKKREHDRNLAINGAFLAAGEAAKRRTVGLLNYERNTPGLLNLPGAV